MGRTVFRADSTNHFAERYLPPQWRAETGFNPRYDAAETVFVERALLEIEAQPYNTLIPPLKSRKFIPTDNTSHAGAKFTGYRRYTRTGVARLITESGLDLPTVGVFVQEDIHQFYCVAAAYQYSYLDLLALGFALQNGQSINLDLELSIAAREAIEKKLDLIAAWGSASAGTFALENEEDVGLLGLINLTSALSYTPAAGDSGHTDWARKTPDEVLADLNGIVAYQVNSTYEVHRPDTILVPTLQYEGQLTRSMGDGRSDTILSYFMRTHRESGNPIDVQSWPYLAGAGAGAADMMIAFKRDPRMLRHMISMEATALPQQQEGLVITVPLIAKTAGVVAPYPLSIVRGIGI